MNGFIWFVAVSASGSLMAAMVIAANRDGTLGALAVLVGLLLLLLGVAWVSTRDQPTRRGPAIVVALGIAAASTLAAALAWPSTFGLFGWLLLGPAAFLGSGIYLLVTRPRHRVGWLMTGLAGALLAYAALLEAVVWSVFDDSGIQGWMSPLLAAESVVMAIGLVCLTLLIGLFPLGTARDGVERVAVRALWLTPLLMLVVLATNEHVVTDGVAYNGLDPVPSPMYVEALSWLSPYTAQLRYLLATVVLLGPLLLARRYRRAVHTERRQIRWVLYAAGAAIAVGVLPYVVVLTTTGSIDHSRLLTLTTVGLVLIPGSVVVAIAQPAWIDTDAVIRKSFAYGALWVGVFVAYATVAAGLGLAVGARLTLEAAIGVTALVAVVFQPARTRLQQVADRWVFGDRPTPFEAVVGFDRAVRASEGTAESGAQIAHLVRNAVRLEWVEVDLPPHPVQTAGEPGGPPAVVTEVTSGDESFGEFRCGPKTRGRLTDADRDLISALASQTGLLVANVRLTSRIVQAQEAERRRIERNIHDGAQQELVALSAKLGLARARARVGDLDEQTLVELQSDVGAILRDLRDFAQGIHPSVLTDGGLVEAVEDRSSRLPIEVVVETSPGLRSTRFGDDIEGAAYFFVAEGLTNVLKHAAASGARVEMFLRGENLELSVGDDGTGFDVGVVRLEGLAGLVDRFAALAGTVALDTVPGSGTTLRARLPVPAGAR